GSVRRTGGAGAARAAAAETGARAGGWAGGLIQRPAPGGGAPPGPPGAAPGSAAALDRALRSVRARAGASRPFTDFAAAPTALDQARLAWRCARPGDTGVHTYASAPERALIAANPTLAADVFAEVLAAFDRLEPGDAELLAQTALAWFEFGGSTAAVGEHLHLHRNTVLHRLKRIERLTGKLFAVPADAALLYMALHTRMLRIPEDRP
ncbi:PucR family transcriptional regulator, partial [Nocardia carnea]|uniref:PucR family transcriptional regulator n=1 Tax=Nocardia carnea TaxID=37328 RepID=UPI002456FCDA